ncbi:response regulator [Collimonas silvisoli]|uniref:response regulator n=1 Tax=Collimonas silvisoli TaxID=2825884 RepID=UPI001B8BD34C|nr:response regulator transcription factor [Collimonas silvisoli]
MFPLSIFLIDDHAMFRSGMAMVLRSGIADIDVFEAGSLEEAMRSPIEAPAILLLDIQLQGLNGLECIAVLQRKWPQVSIIMLSADATPATMRLAMERGAAAFVSKADTATNILAVIERLLRKEPAAGAPGVVSDNAPSEPHLTPRQCEVLDLLCQGLPNKTIGKRLGLSENTVRGHVQALLSFLQVSSRSEAAFAARRSGLVS